MGQTGEIAELSSFWRLPGTVQTLEDDIGEPDERVNEKLRTDSDREGIVDSCHGSGWHTWLNLSDVINTAAAADEMRCKRIYLVFSRRHHKAKAKLL